MLSNIVSKWMKFMHEVAGLLFMNIGALLLRVSLGGLMIYGHGWGKLTTFKASAETFPDPLGLGSTVSFCLALFAEFFCSIAIVLGLATRLALLPLITTMGVAAFCFLSGKPFAQKEMALIYMVGFIALFFTGPGKFSLDAIIVHKLYKQR